ncbi:putative F-box protein At3g16210 [Miscanthus floridulus]|uniref:putative F-box protein At3g16210 n=1 Tax=Miscanthus floridulus TaxID=154761 RepID=UPI003457E74F
MDLLPDGVLTDILRRLAPCSLAASRCVRKSWCTIIDTMRLLRTDLLPLRLDGFFCLDNILIPPPYFFSRNRSTAGRHRRIRGRLDFLGTPLDLHIVDHCNGLLLLDHGRVVNPATRQWVRLPPSPDPSVVMEDFFQGHCLVYDPVVSPHYEVVLIHLLPRVLGPNNEFRADSEWPLSPYTTHVFSSRSWRWEERSFVRQGVAAGTIADKLPESQLFERHSVYLRGKLYVHCENHTVMRITLSNDKFRVIKCPTFDAVRAKSDESGVEGKRVQSSGTCENLNF